MTVPRVPVSAAPPDWAEKAYYALTVYAVMCTVWHIDVPMLGSLAMALLAGYCAQHAVLHSVTVRRALALPFLCALTLLSVQLLFHGEPLQAEFVQTFVTWMMSLVIVQSLALRAGFIHRFALMCFAIGLLTLPYMRFAMDVGGSQRLGLDRRVGFSNPNDLGAWFGFCALYFVVLAIESKRQSVRIIAAICAIGAGLLLGATVSRGPLLAVATAVIVAFRRTLKRGFLPLVVLCAALNVAFALGAFDSLFQNYSARGDVDSGRLSTWPLVVERIGNAPFMGVGMSRIETWVAKQGAAITPHNAYLFFALSSGVLPFLLFIGYFVRAAWRTLADHVHPAVVSERPFRLPLLCYVVLNCLTLDYLFMAPWAVAALSIASLDSPRRVLLGEQRSVRLAAMRAGHLAAAHVPTRMVQGG